MELPPPQDIAAIRQCLGQWLGARGSRSVLLNATGGTKTLSMVAMQAFAEHGLPVRYLDEANGLWIDLLGQGAPYPLPNVAPRIDDVVALHGLRVRARQDDPQWPQWIGIARMLGTQISGLAHELSRLKGAMGNAQNSSTPKFDVPRRLTGPLEKAGIIRRSDAHWCLNTPADQSFLTGGWLEDYALECARQGLAGDRLVQDIASGVKVEELSAREINGQRPDNELDLLILRNGRLFAVECKTSAGKGTGKTQNIPEILYKLAFQRRIGGHSTRLALLHLSQVTGPTEERARMANIKLWGARDVPHLAERLQRWVSGDGGAR